MSINKNYYVIVGYDLSQFKTNKYNEWKWTSDGERYTCYKSKGNIQLFDDPMNGVYLYFGYILCNGDDYDFNTTKININEVSKQEDDILNKLNQLIDIGVIKSPFNSLNRIRYEIIVFEECT